MVDAELLEELRLWIELYGITKLEALLLLIVVLFFWNLRAILELWVQDRTIDKEYKFKTTKLELKLQQERSRRGRK